MNKKTKFIGAFILSSAIIWAAVIIGCAYALKGTDCYDKIQNILVGGVITHLILNWIPTALLFKKLNKE